MNRDQIIFAFPMSGKTTLIDNLKAVHSMVFVDSDDLAYMIKRTTPSLTQGDVYFPLRLKSAILNSMDQGHVVITNKLYKEFARKFCVMYIPTIEEVWKRAKIRNAKNPTFNINKKQITAQVKAGLKFAKKRQMKVVRLKEGEYLSKFLLPNE